MMTIPLARSSGPGEPMPTPRKSSRVAPVSAIACAITTSTIWPMRSTTASAPCSARVSSLSTGNCRTPSSAATPATMLVPPRSTPTM